MIRRPPRYTRTDTLFPYTTLFRSRSDSLSAGAGCNHQRHNTARNFPIIPNVRAAVSRPIRSDRGTITQAGKSDQPPETAPHPMGPLLIAGRSEERRVGKES